MLIQNAREPHRRQGCYSIVTGVYDVFDYCGPSELPDGRYLGC
ncbi:unnamed protein product [Acanthoscelides obtectus]|uniref:Uncharacterized protein n=1 Tax=Acanthoscelides obtectus TaxID=200917 RepID=A0A9P0KEG6_ACAOB|nr:unnamed protein product [Acanthoscelides obtectus]CAK1668805.1 hypothetical protein AOBTE_LOCUS26614 [Acanthoscelides obtectus]